MIPLENSRFYHIYNCGINHQDLFTTRDNYKYFLNLVKKYLHPVAEIYSWVLMKNHFHFLIRIKDDHDINCYKYPKVSVKDSKILNELKWQTTASKIDVLSGSDISNAEILIKHPSPKFHLSHLFNTYSKYYNKLNDRSGALFERPFKRIQINSDAYLKRLVIYINANPVHHGFCENCNDYQWSSYNTILSAKPTGLMRKQVIDWFDDIENFVAMHSSKCELYEDMKELLLEDD